MRERSADKEEDEDEEEEKRRKRRRRRRRKRKIKRRRKKKKHCSWLKKCPGEIDSFEMTFMKYFIQLFLSFYFLQPITKYI